MSIDKRDTGAVAERFGDMEEALAINSLVLRQGFYDLGTLLQVFVVVLYKKKIKLLIVVNEVDLV